MTSNELLEELLSLFRGKIPEVDFFPAWRGEPGSRLRSRPGVTGEIDGETVKPGSEETRYKFRIFLPEGTGADRAEEIFAAMCAAAGEAYPGFSAISRGGLDRDRDTGLLAVACSLSFLTQPGGDGESPSPGRKVVLGGREYTVSGVKTSVSRKGQELVSIGETVPFALLGEETEYTVELEGIDVSGLENMTGFTAEIGDKRKSVYLGCRWKSFSDVTGKAVFTSRQKHEEG